MALLARGQLCYSPLTASNERTLFMADKLITTSSCTGTPPPTSPVLPPCGTTAMRFWLQYATISATSFVDLGLMTHAERPLYLFIQSTLKLANSSASTGLTPHEASDGVIVVSMLVCGVERNEASAETCSPFSSA